MDRQSIHKLFEALNDIVGDASMPWTKRREAILAAADESDKANLGEFIGWFADEEEELS